MFVDKDTEFEFLEEVEEIDIQAIKEMGKDFHDTGSEEEIKEKVDEIIKALKQLDKKIK